MSIGQRRAIRIEPNLPPCKFRHTLPAELNLIYDCLAAF
jgi:hypothetical protein